MEFVRKGWYTLKGRECTDEFMLSFLDSLIVGDIGNRRNLATVRGRQDTDTRRKVNVKARDSRAAGLTLYNCLCTAALK